MPRARSVIFEAAPPPPPTPVEKAAIEESLRAQLAKIREELDKLEDMLDE